EAPRHRVLLRRLAVRGWKFVDGSGGAGYGRQRVLSAARPTRPGSGVPECGWEPLVNHWRAGCLRLMVPAIVGICAPGGTGRCGLPRSHGPGQESVIDRKLTVA